MKSTRSFSLTLSTFVVIALFIGAGILAHAFAPEISSAINGHGVLGKVIFVAAAAFAVIVPVFSNLFLLPFGVVAFGPNVTAFLCILGWWIGSVVSFAIARTYQQKLLARYPSLAQYEYVDVLIPKKHESLALIFLRMTIPVDVLSYALGLFSARISWKQNAVTTLIGITPFAFIFSYIGIFPPLVQVGILTITSILFFLYISIATLRKKVTS